MAGAGWRCRPTWPTPRRRSTWWPRRRTRSAGSTRWSTTLDGREVFIGPTPIKALGAVDLDALGTSFDGNVVPALRLIRLLTPALEESGGAVVMIGSMVVRFSQLGMGPYKLTKAAMLAMAQSLATEFGPRGIRVNSVAPGHIWGDSLQWYFGYLAHKRGVEVQQIYDETAAGIDLRRLPEPDEVADAVVFLASPLARAITGQCLDVNCGEYHH